jgi:hypothetical protein
VVWPCVIGSSAALLLRCIRQLLAQVAAAVRERRVLDVNEGLRGVTRALLATGIDEELAVAVSGGVQCEGWAHLAGRRAQAARAGCCRPAPPPRQRPPGAAAEATRRASAAAVLCLHIQFVMPPPCIVVC